MASPEQKKFNGFLLPSRRNPNSYTTKAEYSEHSRTVPNYLPPLPTVQPKEQLTWKSCCSPNTVLTEHMTLWKLLNLGFILLNYKMGVIILAWKDQLR